MGSILSSSNVASKLPHTDCAVPKGLSAIFLPFSLFYGLLDIFIHHKMIVEKKIQSQNKEKNN